MFLESQVQKNGPGVGKDVSVRLYKKVEQLNAEVEKRLEKIHEHYQVKWKAKGEDFITEIAEHKSRINSLLEENARLTKMQESAESNGQVAHYKALFRKKDDELERLRSCYTKLEGEYQAIQIELDTAESRC